MYSPGVSVAEAVALMLDDALPDFEGELDAAGAACADREKAETARSAKALAYMVVSKRRKVLRASPRMWIEKGTVGSST